MAEIFDSFGRQELTEDSTPDPVEVAQATPGGEPIGQVETLAGTVVAVRADGLRVELEVGDSIFQGDTLESGNDGAIGVVLADQTTFSMAENGSMVMDEMVYDPGTQEGGIGVSVLQGVFTFVSGEIAKTDPDAMTLSTPVATIGIRGTQVALSYDPADEGGEGLKIVLMEEKDGFVGEVVVQNAAGLQVLNLADQGTTVISATAAPAQPIQFDRNDIVNAFGGALGALPASDSANTYGVEPTTEEGALEEEAGEEEATEEELAEDEAAEEELAEGEVEEELEEEIAEEGEEEIEEELAEEGEENIEELAEVETAAGGDADLGGDGDFNVTGDFGTGGSTAAEDAAAAAEAAATAAAQAAAAAEAAAAEAAAQAAADAAAAAEALRQATADEPDLTVGPASGGEDQVGGIALDISAVSTDTVGNETLSVNISGLPTGATLSAGTPNVDGTWTLTADQLSGLTLIPAENYNGDFELSVTATSTVSDRIDGDSASTFGTIAVSVAAVNDAPTITGSASTDIVEDASGVSIDELSTASDVAQQATGSLSITDVDAGEAVFDAQTATPGTHGTFSVTPGGDWTYDLDAAATDALPAGAVVTETFDVVSADGTATPVTITITGTDDAPTITGSAAGDLLESDVAQQATGSLTITDVDAGESVFDAQTATPGSHGTFSVTPGGDWTYDLDAAATDALPAGAVVTETFDVVSADGTATPVTITITGTDDAPTITGSAAGDLLESDVAQQATGSLTITDVDAGESVFDAQTATRMGRSR